MLGRWFKKKSKLRDPDATVRLGAVAAVDSDDSAVQESLVELSKHDEDLRVRTAAIDKLSNTQALESLLLDETVAVVVAARMATLLARLSEWDWLAHDAVFSAFLKHMETSDHNHVMAHVDSAERLTEMLLVMPKKEATALLENPLLQSEAGLQTLERTTRGRDKNLNRAARLRIDEVKQCRSSQAAIFTRIVDLDEVLRKDSSDINKLNKLLASRRELEQESKQLGEACPIPLPSPELPDSPISEQDIAAQEEEQARLIREQLAQQAAKEDQAATAKAAAKIAAEEISAPAEIDADQLAQAKLATPFWQGFGSRDFGAGKDSIGARIASRTKWQTKIAKEIKALHWPDEVVEPEVLKLAQAEYEKIGEELKSLNQAIENSQRDLSKLLTEIDQAIEAGQTREVGRSMKTARELLQQIPANGDTYKSLERHIAGISARIAELRDWQKFATDPKREELLSQMEQMALAPVEPQLQIERLKNLRTAWQQLGRPTSATERSQQERFDRLADQAFEPCKAFFAEQGQQRADNLTARAAITEQLAEYVAQTDWGSADFKTAEQIMRTAREEWRRYHPCERKALKPVEQKFEALQSELHSRLKAHWDANIETKRNIIESAKQLTEAAGAPNQAEQVKRLQRDWKNVGPTPRSMDQRLWKEFRSHCDAVFANLNEHQAQQRQQQSNDIAAFNLAVANLEQAAERAMQQLDATAKEYDTLNTAITQQAATISNGEGNPKLQDARSKYQRALKLVANVAAKNEVEQFKLWDIDVSQREQAGEEVAERSLVTDAQQDCLRLTLESELAAELPSPEIHQTQRMALQIEFMNEGIRDLAQRDYRELITRWNNIGPKTEAEDTLRERFFDAILTRLG